MGKSRSVAAIMVYLMEFLGMSYEESLSLIRVNRPMAKPNISYEEQLKEFEQKTLV
jgi:protein-tyrosine phosphatase